MSMKVGKNNHSGNYKVIFFDLDGTLLPVETGVFLRGYNDKASEFASDKCEDSERFAIALDEAFKAMLETEHRCLNAEIFWQVFRSHAGDFAGAWCELVDRFYKEAFNSIGDDYNSNANASKAVNILKDKGYPLMLTTQPLFPIGAVHDRLAWSDVAPENFDYITTYDNSRLSKPHALYFQDCMDKAGVESHEVLMVGNHTVEDLGCLDLGIDAYIITDYMCNPVNLDLEACAGVEYGTMDEFVEYVQALPDCMSGSAIKCKSV